MNEENKKLHIEIPQDDLLKPRIVIFGVGGAGGNAINNMMRSNLEGVEFIAANTDAQALQNSLAKNRIQLGVKTTKGLGAGSYPDRGAASAEENVKDIEKYLKGANMVFIAAGMGGGTGTGAAPVIARLAREKDILTVGVITKPFHFEGKYRMETAEEGIEKLKKYVDTLIIIPNQNLFRIANEQTTFESAFKMADDVLHAGVRGVTDLITMPGLVNLDFADIRTIMTKMGKAMMGTGEAEGENRAIAACEAAIANPLLDDISIKGAKGVLVNMTGGPDMTLFEADMAVNAIRKEVDPSANIIFGSAFNENMKGKLRVSVVATGIDIEDYKRESLGSRDNFEPSRFNIEDEKADEQDSTTTTKSFFDPGIASKPVEEEVEEISNTDYQPKKTYSKEENTDYGNIPSENDQDNKTEFTQVSFFGNELEEKLENKEPIKEEVKEEIPKSKKSSSGFGLFGFMNKNKSEAKSKVETPKEPVVELIVDNEENVENENINKGENFESTILDDTVSNDDNKIEEDILNVPAFFRRKKK